MSSRFAVLDLGSNTFHLLIVERDKKHGFTEIYRDRVYTKLSKGGGTVISQESFKKGMECLIDFRSKLDKYKVGKYLALGTATLRIAKNGPDFLAQANKEAAIKIELISGIEEANYIARGVLLATGNLKGNYLIIDIGGGSVEFVLLQENEVIWKDSFKVGLGVLKHKFHHSEPISENEIEQLKAFLDDKLKSVQKMINQTGAINALIGASGSFEVIQQILGVPKRTEHSYSCNVEKVMQIIESIVPMADQERLNSPLIPAERADLMVVALLLIEWAIRESACKEVIISNFAMKEGIIKTHLL